MNKKVLVIPHSSELTVRRRQREIAFSLAKDYQIYFLSWLETEEKNFFKRVGITFADFFKKSRVYKRQGLTIAEFPFLHRPLSLIKTFNQNSLSKFIVKNNIDVVINGLHYFFPTPDKSKVNFKHIFDINDLPAQEVISPLGRYSYEFAKTESLKADVVTACSSGLVDYTKDQFGVRAEFIPNGAYLNEFKNIDAEAVKGIKDTYHLNGKFVLGYIGRVGEWIDIEFLIHFFRVLKNKYQDAALLIVGAGEGIEFYKEKIKDEDIVFTGGIHHDLITPYFCVLDVGLLPSKKSMFQDLAFHIKLIEYTAAKKSVVSSSLEEVKRLKFPNIKIADLNIDDWVKAIDEIRQNSWNTNWDNLADEYSWERVGDEFKEIIEN